MIMPLFLSAQPKVNSPITRFGIGEMYRGDLNQSGSTGGLFAAWVDPYRQNPVNPAALPYLQSTSLEVGIFSKYNNFQRNQDQQSGWSGNIDYIALAFPLRSRVNEMLEPSNSPWDIGMGFHLTPVSLVGYDVEFIQYGEGIDSVSSIFEGFGGLTQLAWSTGVKYKDLSFGLQLGYVFGKIQNNFQFDLLTLQAPYYTQQRHTYNLNGFNWQGGVIYKYVLEKPTSGEGESSVAKTLNLGAYFSSSSGFSTTSNLILERVNINYNSGGPPFAVDTLRFLQGEKKRGLLPGRFGIGATLQRGVEYQFGANIEFRNWEVFSIDDGSGFQTSFRNTWRYSVGGEYCPNAIAYRQYHKKIRYRIGLFYEQDPRIIGEKKFASYGGQLGFGFPVILPRQQVSFIDLAAELGRSGDITIQQDTYIRMRLGVTLSDNSWFYKRKYN